LSLAVETPVRLENEIGLPVRVDLRRPQGTGPFPVVVILPGFKGFKDWGMFPPTARRLAERGIATACLNTSMNGVREGEAFEDLEGFAHNTPGREVKDVERVIASLRSGELGAAFDARRLGLLGHSRGGGVALLTAARDAQIRAVVTWASIASFLRYTPRAIAEWRSAGRLDVPNLRTGQILWLDRSVLEDLESHRLEYDLERACGETRAPCLFVHGERDEAVDPEDARRLYGWCRAREKELLLVPGAGHTFGAVHPWAGPPPAWEHVATATENWFGKWLA
jgi:dienelactone hydrolase